MSGLHIGHQASRQHDLAGRSRGLIRIVLGEFGCTGSVLLVSVTELQEPGRQEV